MEIIYTLIKFGWIAGGIIGLCLFGFFLWVIYIGMTTNIQAGQENPSRLIDAEIQAKEAKIAAKEANRRIGLLEKFLEIQLHEETINEYRKSERK